MKDKGLAIVLALLFGSLGAHKFYLGDSGSGIIYLFLTVVSCGVIPAFMGWIDALMLAVMPQAEFERRYNSIAASYVDIPTRVTVRRVVIGPDGQRHEVVEERVSGVATGPTPSYDDLVPEGRMPRQRRSTPNQPEYASRAPRDRAELERFVLQAASDNNGSLSPAELSLMTKMGLSQARDVLEYMQKSGVSEVEVDDEGLVRFVFPEFVGSAGRRMSDAQSATSAFDEELDAR